MIYLSLSTPPVLSLGRNLRSQVKGFSESGILSAWVRRLLGWGGLGTITCETRTITHKKCMHQIKVTLICIVQNRYRMLRKCLQKLSEQWTWTVFFTGTALHQKYFYPEVPVAFLQVENLRKKLQRTQQKVENLGVRKWERRGATQNQRHIKKEVPRPTVLVQTVYTVCNHRWDRTFFSFFFKRATPRSRSPHKHLDPHSRSNP
jgi:hypothetical protein